MRKINLKNIKSGPNILVLFLVILAILFGLSKLIDIARITKTPTYTEFKKEVIEGKVKSVKIAGSDITGQYKDSPMRFELTVQKPSLVLDLLEKNNVDVSFNYPSADFSFWHLLFLLSLLIMPLVAWYFLRQLKGASNGGTSGVFSVGKSKAKMFMPSQIKFKFDSVAGVKEAKEELRDVVNYLKDPEKYSRLGAKLTKGILLSGHPGNGKTLLAKAVAGEANCPFFSLNGADFIELFAGVGAARVRDLFAQARKNAPCIIFIDEIDAIGRQRVNGFGNNEEREQTLNQLLSEMDGFDSSGVPIVIIGATNRPDILDKALIRPGRFDRQVLVPYPDLQSRLEILQLHAKNIKMDSSIDLYKIARATTGLSGAELANIINESAINASKTDQDCVLLKDFEEAKDKIFLGKQHKNKIMSFEERKITAYHESGHALIGCLLDHWDPVYKVTILPRGSSLGVTHFIPERDKYIQSKQELEASVMTALGGRGAEELVFNCMYTGAYSDFLKATSVLRNMICNYGMNNELGNVVYSRDNYEYSEETAKKIDNEVIKLMDYYYKKVLDMLISNRDKLDKLAYALLEKETLLDFEIYEILEIKPKTQDLSHNINQSLENKNWL